MSTFGAVLLSIVVVLLFTLVTRSCRRPRNAPPGPRGLPIIGNGLVMMKDDFLMVITEYSKTYGGILSLMAGPKLFVVLSSFDAAKEALVDNGAAFSKRLPPPVFAYLLGTGGSILEGHGKTWKARRNFVASAFRDFGVGKRSLEQRINDEATYVIETIDQTKGQPLDLHHTINNAVSNIICSLCFGQRFDYNDKRFKTLLEKLEVNFTDLSRSRTLQILPFLVYTPLFRYLKDNFQSLIDFIQSLTKEHEDSLNSDDIRDILDKFLLTIKRQEENNEEIRFKKEHQWRLVFELFMAGTDTTTNTLLLTILFVTYYQDIQRKIFDEIMEVVGDARRPRLSDRSKMPYTEATILEVLRHRPAAPLGLPRMVTTDSKVAGYDIPEGTGVLLNVFAIHHDPKLWENPYSFDPTRFLSPDGKNVIKNETLMTFGAGQRRCPGEALSRMELFFFVANIFQRFRLRFPENAKTPDLSMPGREELSLRPRPFEICADRR